MLKEHAIDVMLTAPDLSAVKRFYGDGVGLEVLIESHDFVTFRCGGDSRLVVTRTSTPSADATTRASWRVYGGGGVIDGAGRLDILVDASHHAPLPRCRTSTVDTGRTANWAVAGRPLSRRRGVYTSDGSHHPDVGTPFFFVSSSRRCL